MAANHRERLRKRAQEHFESLQPHEVLELMLFFSYPRVDTNPIAHDLLKQFGSLYNVCNAPRQELLNVYKVGEKAADFLKLLPGFVRAYEQSVFGKGEVFDTTAMLGRFAVSLLFGRVNEAVFLICLDSKRRVIQHPMIAEGSPGEVYVEPRTVVERVAHTSTKAVVLCHNHPAGTLLPSNKDLEVTTKVKAALETIDVVLLDHIIVAHDNYISLREEQFRF